MDWQELKEEFQGQQGGEPAPAEIGEHLDELFCSLLDAEYEVYLESEEMCAQRAPELVLSGEGIRRFPQQELPLRRQLWKPLLEEEK